MNDLFETPVLFLVFNRPEPTQEVFNLIKKAKPKYLYIAADGPREKVAGESGKCEEVRNIIKQVDWECEVKTLFREKNLGCGVSVSSAISWFFENVEEGIILEDDCLPSLSFFQFCRKMLDTYRNDQRIWHIGGYNMQDKHTRGDADYYFSKETAIWGWATWRRVWKHYNLTLETLETFERSSLRPYLKSTKLHSITALRDYKRVMAGKVNTWDYQYVYCQLVNYGLSVAPNVNLIENIGFDGPATHYHRRKNIYIGNKATEKDYTEIKHPIFFVPEVDADKYTYNKREGFIKKMYIFFWYYFIYRVPNKSK